VLIGGLVFQLGGIDLATPWRGLLSAAVVIALSWFALKLYDEPLRRRLMQRSKRGVAPATA
jgi:peptidoglycan/LPS O-acetylase OafA/YrhL